MLKPIPIPVLGFAAHSGSGKTTLLIKLLPLLKQHGLRVGLIKHIHHSFEIDYPGKDSYELRKAGASPVLIGSKQRWALMVESDFTKARPSPILYSICIRIGWILFWSKASS